MTEVGARRTLPMIAPGRPARPASGRDAEDGMAIARAPGIFGLRPPGSIGRSDGVADIASVRPPGRRGIGAMRGRLADRQTPPRRIA
jgi:hypothetical protein